MSRNIIRFGRDQGKSGIERKTGLSTSHICDITNPKSPRFDPTFPKRLALSSRLVGFFEDEVDEWLDHRSLAADPSRATQFEPLQQARQRAAGNNNKGKRKRRRRRVTRRTSLDATT